MTVILKDSERWYNEFHSIMGYDKSLRTKLLAELRRLKYESNILSKAIQYDLTVSNCYDVIEQSRVNDLDAVIDFITDLIEPTKEELSDTITDTNLVEGVESIKSGPLEELK